MDEKLRFVFEYELGDYSMTELCQRYEIARETGYVWLRRYQRCGRSARSFRTAHNNEMNPKTPGAGNGTAT